MVDRSGELRSPRLVKSSGHAILDEEAMALLRRAAPMPVFPKELTQNSLSLTVPIKFSSR
jgi:protein TonB